jgi:hypothetical protein
MFMPDVTGVDPSGSSAPYPKELTHTATVERHGFGAALAAEFKALRYSLHASHSGCGYLIYGRTVRLRPSQVLQLAKPPLATT